MLFPKTSRCCLLALVSLMGAGCNPLPKGPPCTDYRDQKSPGTVRFHVENARTEPLFFNTGCDPNPEVFVRPVNGARVSVARERSGLSPDFCAQTCEDHQTSIVTCYEYDDECVDVVIRVEPGGWFTSEWQRLEWATRDMPAICSASMEEENCVQVKESKEGEYLGWISASLTCATVDGGDCRCSNGEKTCPVERGRLLSTDGGVVTAESKFNVPDDTEPHLVFR